MTLTITTIGPLSIARIPNDNTVINKRTREVMPMPGLLLPAGQRCVFQDKSRGFKQSWTAPAGRDYKAFFPIADTVAINRKDR